MDFCLFTVISIGLLIAISRCAYIRISGWSKHLSDILNVEVFAFRLCACPGVYVPVMDRLVQEDPNGLLLVTSPSLFTYILVWLCVNPRLTRHIYGGLGSLSYSSLGSFHLLPLDKMMLSRRGRQTNVSLQMARRCWKRCLSIWLIISMVLV